MSQTISPIPPGFHTLTPYLIVPDGKAAIAFYQNAFGATVHNFEATPDGKFLNAELNIGTSKVMLGEHAIEIPPVDSANLPAVSIYMYVEDVDATWANAVAAGAHVLYPLSDRFYGNREGGVRDPFGVTWWIASRIAELTSEEVVKLAAEHFNQSGS